MVYLQKWLAHNLQLLIKGEPKKTHKTDFLDYYKENSYNNGWKSAKLLFWDQLIVDLPRKNG